MRAVLPSDTKMPQGFEEFYEVLIALKKTNQGK